ncbi:hypothetical protein AB0K00_33000 [Dactylosporangium sp. NPDC049525]|uniref:hypothetical protein n=1 Tax=Dactylosporangium sp. NPDC049525 TaxID=3154730 RepID=UPI0034408CE3
MADTRADDVLLRDGKELNVLPQTELVRRSRRLHDDAAEDRVERLLVEQRIGRSPRAGQLRHQVPDRAPPPEIRLHARSSPLPGGRKTGMFWNAVMAGAG